jgi:hypothetical protein
MRMPLVRGRLRRLLDTRTDRRRHRAERAHVKDVASRGRDRDVSGRHWGGGGGAP